MTLLVNFSVSWSLDFTKYTSCELSCKTFLNFPVLFLILQTICTYLVSGYPLKLLNQPGKKMKGLHKYIAVRDEFNCTSVVHLRTPCIMC